MARLTNTYGAQPIAQPARRGGGGGGGGNNRPRNPNQQRNRNAGGGAGAGTGTGNDIGGGLYLGPQGGSLANLDPERFISDLLAGAGQMDYSGTAYGDYVNKTRAAELLRQYQNAQQFNQSLNPVDWAQQQYGAGYTQTGGGKHNKGATTTFNAGSLPASTVDSYNNWFSNTSPDIFLSNKNLESGLTLPTGGNAEFDRYLTQYYNPKTVANWQQAQAAGIAAGGTPGAGAPGTPGGNANTTLPFGDTGDFGGDPMNRRAWLRDQGMKRLNQMNPHARKDARSQYADYTAGFGAAPPGATAGSAAPASLTTPLSLADYIAGRDQTTEARNAFAFRPNSMRAPGPINLSGRYSWWG